MAKKADSEGVRSSIELPDYAKGIKMLRDSVKTRKLRISGIQGEISGVWEQIEKMGINKEGARIFLKLDDKQPHERNDILRTIQLMADASDWDKAGDMIDQAAGNVVQMPQPGGKPPAAAPAASPGGPSTKPRPETAKPARSAKAAGKGGGENPGAAPIRDGVDTDDGVLAQADYKQVMADRIVELSTLTPAEAFKVAGEIWDDLQNRDRDSKRTRANAIKNAEAEVESWPEASDDKPAA